MLRALYTAAAFLAATLVFVVQPLAARKLLPVVGGSPVVWSACLVFFQTALLVGYGYAHVLSRVRSLGLQVGVHALVAAAAFLFGRAEMAAAAAEGFDPSTRPMVSVFWGLTRSVGAPFVVLSASSPLIQRWFSYTWSKGAHDPYFLYVGSNAGSLLALFGYPFLIEPFLKLSTQAWIFRLGVLGSGLLVVAAGGCALYVRSKDHALAVPGPPTLTECAGLAQVLRWLLLAFLPSSLTLGVTGYLTADVGALPFLWTVPLGLYLLSFICAFSRHCSRFLRVVSPAVSGFVLFAAFTSGSRIEVVPPALAMALHLGAFFMIALLLHARLASLRPSPHGLTRYYLWLSLGGALGGIFNVLLAPRLFPWVFEYPLVLGLAYVYARVTRVPGRAELVRMGLVAASAVGSIVLGRWLIAARGLASSYAFFNLPLLALALVFVRRPLVFATLVVLLPAGNLLLESAGIRRELSRSFFGVHQVMVDGRMAVYKNGTTVHGVQALAGAERCVPRAYYHPGSPIASVVTEQRARAGAAPLSVAVIGLGVGTLMAHARPGERWTFFEIDPEVVRLARQGGVFSFLGDCAPKGVALDVQLVDGRLGAARLAAGALDLVVVDAFSSDTIPLHLMSREAMTLYRMRLRPGGAIVLHISNRYYELERPLRRLADELGLRMGLAQDVPRADEEQEFGHLPSTWALFVSTGGPMPSAFMDLPPAPKAALLTDETVSPSALLHPRWMLGGRE